LVAGKIPQGILRTVVPAAPDAWIFQKDSGGFLSADDLAAYRSGFEEPVETSFGDIRLFACGPWCQGPSLLQTLNLLDVAELYKLGHNSTGYLHHLTEAVKLAFADRETYFGDHASDGAAA
jgi:gamma-glutamyltranspeptidase/glutathione hydrolase